MIDVILKGNLEIIWVEAPGRDFYEDADFELEVGKGEEKLDRVEIGL